jgi:hypothetical protein
MTNKLDQGLPTASIVRLSDHKLSPAAVLAEKFLAEGQVIALPTDTVYGIAALVQNKDAVKKLYDIKGYFCAGQTPPPTHTHKKSGTFLKLCYVKYDDGVLLE